MICLPRMREALNKIGPGLTLRSLIAVSLSYKKPASETNQYCRGRPIRNMSAASMIACMTKKKKAVLLLYSSQGISSSGTPKMKHMSTRHHLRHEGSDCSSSTVSM
jgi:hypothetical protein